MANASVSALRLWFNIFPSQAMLSCKFSDPEDRPDVGIAPPIFGDATATYGRHGNPLRTRPAYVFTGFHRIGIDSTVAMSCGGKARACRDREGGVWEFAVHCAAKCLEARHKGGGGSPAHADGSVDARGKMLIRGAMRYMGQGGKRSRATCSVTGKAALRGCVSHLREAELCPSPERLRAVGRLRLWLALSVKPVAAEAAPTGNVIRRRSPERNALVARDRIAAAAVRCTTARLGAASAGATMAARVAGHEAAARPLPRRPSQVRRL